MQASLKFDCVRRTINMEEKKKNMEKFEPSYRLLSILRKIGACEDYFTLSQIINYLGDYIKEKKLFDRHQPSLVYCDNDLMTLTNRPALYIDEFPTLLQKHVSKTTPKILATPPMNCNRKRKFSDIEDTSEFRQETMEEDEESDNSIHSKTTAIVASSSDDLWFLSEDEHFEEYEPESMDESNTKLSIGSQSPVEDVVGVLTTDNEFFADEESINSDREDSSSGGETFHRQFGSIYCGPDISRSETDHGSTAGDLRRKKKVLRKRRKKSRLQPVKFNSAISTRFDSDEDDIESNDNKFIASPLKHQSSNASTIILTEEEETPNTNSPKTQKPFNLRKDSGIGSSLEVEFCSICQEQSKDAVLIHGKSAHQVTCYPCGKRLRNNGKPCPICRRPIKMVAKNYML
ncbi:DgyrCDS455 [Dimorphilus gyrociliatus]|uniref:DgyrCDS455 n=1 Tax=Dimorphilus gyrociliatus TaxID=2664684 RepID=A0A7I8V4Q2_9ANNE|nr:DgyrCDS455 [Dimorphilus gyrociliatus]